MAGRLDFDFTFGNSGSGQKTGRSRTVRFVVLGDFSGAAGDRTPLEARRLHRIDLDRFDEVMAALAPRARLEIAGTPAVDASFDSLDAFHPDALFARLPIFALNRELRQRLRHPSTAAETVALLLGPAAAPAPENRTDSDSPFAALLGPSRANGPVSRATGAQAAVAALLAQAVSSHATPATDARVAQAQAGVDAALATQMRDVLAAPELRALEARWRGVHWLIQNGAETEAELFLFDVTRAELAEDLATRGGQGLRAALASPAGWSALLVDLTFGAGAADLALLEPLGALAGDLGGPLVAAGALGDEGAVPDDDRRWQTFRSSAAAAHVALCAPRLLLRAPYGPRREPIEAFAFDELVGGDAHARCLWGNGAFAAAAAIVAASSAAGETSYPEDGAEIGDLPLCVFDEGGEKVMQPCAERWLSEPTLARMIERGLSPLASVRDRNAVRLVRFHSVGGPETT